MPFVPEGNSTLGDGGEGAYYYTTGGYTRNGGSGYVNLTITPI